MGGEIDVKVSGAAAARVAVVAASTATVSTARWRRVFVGVWVAIIGGAFKLDRRRQGKPRSKTSGGSRADRSTDTIAALLSSVDRRVYCSLTTLISSKRTTPLGLLYSTRTLSRT